jgi:hypothetical protein
MEDKLDIIFSLREDFMRKIKSSIPDSYPEWPIDIDNKLSQKAIREIAFRGVEEVFEALLHLKNWKDHRSGAAEFDRQEFLEEMVDAFKYFTAIMIMLDVDSTEFFEAYVRKHKIICSRLE